jgi:hypothetical protein
VQAESTTYHDRGFETYLERDEHHDEGAEPILLSNLTRETTHRGIRNLKTIKFHLIISMLIIYKKYCGIKDHTLFVD